MMYIKVSSQNRASALPEKEQDNRTNNHLSHHPHYHKISYFNCVRLLAYLSAPNELKTSYQLTN